ncbi:Nodulin-like [Sesbania bispinosa]|nr:Nodulin-like [Sesbania bispinosa]
MLLFPRFAGGKWLGFVTAICLTISLWAKDVGKAFGVLSGLASDRWPTSVILMIGAIMGFIGYGVQWLCCQPENHSTPLLADVYILVYGWKQHNMDEHSSACDLYEEFSTKPWPNFWYSQGLCGTQHSNLYRHMHCYVFFRPFQVSSNAYHSGLLVLLAMPLLVPLYLAIFKSNLNVDQEQQQIHEPLLAQKISAEKEEGQQGHEVNAGTKVEEVETKQKPVLGEEHTIIEMHLVTTDVSIFISFISIWGFFGRIISGSLSEYFIRKSGMPRLVWNAASQVLMAVGYIAMALALPGSLYIGSMLVGICYGVRLTITPAAASELFGLKYYGLLYNILILNLPIGSFLFSGLIAGYLYDMEATSVPGGGNTCIGAHCYMLVYVIMAFACVLGCGLDLLLTVRTKKIYAKIHQERSLVNSQVQS